MFDWDAFADSVRYHCLQSKNFGPKIEDVIVSSASIYFSFVKDGEDDVSTPCWAQLDVLPALQQGKGNVMLPRIICNLDSKFSTVVVFHLLAKVPYWQSAWLN